MPNVLWIVRDEEGLVRAGCLVEYMERATLKEWRTMGRAPELVDFGDSPCTLCGPLPQTARVIMQLLG